MYYPNVFVYYNHMRLKPFKFFNKNDYPTQWRTITGEMIDIENLGIRHINNIMNCLTGCGRAAIPDPYLGRTNNEWYMIMHNELCRRRNG